MENYKKGEKGLSMQPDFSIIIPVFNAEKTIQKCIKSIQMQTYSSFEAILIDDGSSDQSGQLCDQVEQQDQRFLVIHQKNAGPSVARNKGLALAKGRYIVFVDSDDTIEKNYLQCIKAQFDLSDADVIFIGYSLFTSEEMKINTYLAEKYSSGLVEQALELSAHDMFGYTWIKVFRRDKIIGLKFDEEVSLFEDEIFTCDALSHCQNISIVKKPLYNYVQNGIGTLMTQTRQNYCELQEKVYLAWKRFLTQYHRENLLPNRADFLVNSCMYYFYERDINVNAFLSCLSKCTYFLECTLNTPFCNALRKNRRFSVRCMRLVYRIKVAIGRVMHR